MLRLSLVSDDSSLVSHLDGFAVDVIPREAPALTGAEVGTDVFVVDVRRDEQLSVVSDLVCDERRYRSAGAHGCVPSGSPVRELAARIRDAARHHATSAPGGGSRGESGEYRLGDLSIALTRREVTSGARPVELTPVEFRLLALLVRHMPDTTPDHRLAAAVRSGEHDTQRRLRSHIHDLRAKLGDDCDRPKVIVTEPGFGYRLELSA
jgi:DNA-binding response OmpR family regulator